PDFVIMNQISTISAFLLALSTLPFMYNVYKTWKHGKPVNVDDPWGYGMSLEWATSSPPPRHNFVKLPRIRSERPAFDLHHPEVAALDEIEPDPSVLERVFGDPEHPGEADVRGSEEER